MHSFGESPSVVVESRLSQILEDSPLPKYCLSAKACQGILNRANKRGKELPPELKAALEYQAGCEPTETPTAEAACGFTNRGFASGDVAETMRSDPHGAYPMVAGFKSGQGAQARSIGYQEEVAPTLPSEAGGNSVPAIVRANEEFDWL